MLYRRYIITKISDDTIQVTNDTDYKGKFIGEFSANLVGFNGIFYIGDIPISVTNNEVSIRKSIPNIGTISRDLYIKNIFWLTKGAIKTYGKYYTKSQLIDHNMVIRDEMIIKKERNAVDKLKYWADKFNRNRTLS